MRVVAPLIVGLACAGAGSAQAQEAIRWPESAPQAREAFEALQRQTKPWVQTLPSGARRVGAATPARSSDRPGVCERDFLELVTEPAPRASPETQRLISITAARSYALIAIAGGTRLSPRERERETRRCAEAGRLREDVASWRESTEGPDPTWLAGQAIRQLSSEHRGKAAKAGWPCERGKACPSSAEIDSLLTLEAFFGASWAPTGCDSNQVCLRVTTFPKGPDGERRGSLWVLTLRGARTDVYGASPRWKLVGVERLDPMAFD